MNRSPLPSTIVRRSARFLTIVIAATLLGTPVGTARANMAAPPEPQTVKHGSQLGEPAGGLRDVFIEHETLRMNLRPLAHGKPAAIEAIYRVRNDGPVRTLDLLFVANGLAPGASTVAVDGKRAAAQPGAAGTLPASWQPPSSTPDPASDSAAALPYEPRSRGALSFRITLPAGRHEIRVRYPAEASAYSRNDLTPVWQLGYVLAPARDWAGFGTLDVRSPATFTHDGEIIPGASPGTLTIAGNMQIPTSGIMTIELGGPTPGKEYDQLVITGAAIFAEGTLNVTTIGAFDPKGLSFDVLTFGPGSTAGPIRVANVPIGCNQPVNTGTSLRIVCP